MLDKLELHGDIYVQPLMGSVNVLSDEEVDMGGFLEDDVGEQGAPVFLGIGFRREVLDGDVFLRK